jgi:hypothetical protein
MHVFSVITTFAATTLLEVYEGKQEDTSTERNNPNGSSPQKSTMQTVYACKAETRNMMTKPMMC